MRMRGMEKVLERCGLAQAVRAAVAAEEQEGAISDLVSELTIWCTVMCFSLTLIFEC